MPCPVPFCRRDCPPLPPDAEVLRASGEAPCDVCGKPIREHEQYYYPSGMRHCVKVCDGTYYHT